MNEKNKDWNYFDPFEMFEKWNWSPFQKELPLIFRIGVAGCILTIIAFIITMLFL